MSLASIALAVFKYLPGTDDLSDRYTVPCRVIKLAPVLLASSNMIFASLAVIALLKNLNWSIAPLKLALGLPLPFVIS